jgi:hypothetical protein
MVRGGGFMVRRVDTWGVTFEEVVNGDGFMVRGGRFMVRRGGFMVRRGGYMGCYIRGVG